MVAGAASRGTVSEVDKAMDLSRIENAVREMLEAAGEDPDREGLRDTPSRVARMYQELFDGLNKDPAQHLSALFTERYDELVVLRDIPFNSMCEHHLMPFEGHAHVAYLPDGQVVGISKLARVVDAFAHRPQVQERLTSQVAETLEELLRPRGVGVVIEAQHLCMTMRGVEKQNAVAVTSVMRGRLRTDAGLREEFLALLREPGSEPGVSGSG